jgi:hypothetical protein
MLLETLHIFFIRDLYVVGDPVLDEVFELTTDLLVIFAIVILRIKFVDLIFIAEVLRGVLDRIFVIELVKEILFGREMEVDICEEPTQ